MNKEKQTIEEMALTICESRGATSVDTCRKCRHHENRCLYQDIACALYNEDYRKQNIGRWIATLGSFKCSVCNDFVECVSAFCPSCGATMKGCEQCGTIRRYR